MQRNLKIKTCLIIRLSGEKSETIAETDYAIFLENGNFEWVKRLTEEEEKLLEEE